MTFRRFARPLASVCSLLAVSATAFAGPTDIVPRGDLAYDLLGSLAAAGRVPRASLRDFFRGDRLYTRQEMARFVLTVREGVDQLTPEQRAQLQALEIKFGPELKRLGAPARLTNGSEQAGALTGALKVRGGASPVSGDLIARVSATTALGRDGYAAVSLGNYRDEWYSEDGSARGGYPTVETAVARINTRVLDVTVGRMPFRWGPGYVGGMLFSDDAPSIPMVQVEKGFALPGWLGRQLGPLYFTQFAGEFREDEVPGADPNATGTRRFVHGRRLETAGTGPWQFAISEAFKSTRLPDAFWSFTLPYYAYQDTWTRGPGEDRPLLGGLPSGTYPNTAWFNYLADINVTYRVDDRGGFVYTDLLLDDLQAPKGIGTGNRTPRKIGLQGGVYLPDLDGRGRYGLRLEAATVDRGTYANASAPVAWSQNNFPLGYPTGPNANVFFGRFDAVLSERVKAAAEGFVRRRKDDSVPSPEQDRLSLFATYDLRRDVFLGFRFDYVRTTFPGVGEDKNARAEFSLGAGF